MTSPGCSKLPCGQMCIAADCLWRGTGQEQAAFILSAWRESKGVPKATVSSRQVVRTTVAELGGVLWLPNTVLWLPNTWAPLCYVIQGKGRVLRDKSSNMGTFSTEPFMAF